MFAIMKILSHTATILSSIIFWLGSVYLTVILGWLIFCWQCGTKETNQWLFWPLVYLIALGGAYLFSKLPAKYGGEKFGLAAITMSILGVVFYFISA